MNRFLLKLIIIITFFIPQLNIILANTVHYISPVPDSKYNNERTNIIIGYEGKLNASLIKGNSITVTGSYSGLHSGRVLLAEKNYRLLFIPDVPFTHGEKVTVSGISDLQSFSFYIRPTALVPKDEDYSELKSGNNLNNPPFRSDYPLHTDSLPAFTIYNSGNTAPGYIFISNFNTPAGTPNHLMILQNDGTPKWAYQLQAAAYDFKKQNENMITYFEEMVHFYLGRNASYQVTDSFFCGNGYTTDLHEVRVMEDGSAWLMSYDPELFDMSGFVPGGKSDAIVTGLIIQKINAQKNVVFQWRSWDHFQVTDATHENLVATSIDYVHGNAIDVDFDGNIIISSRHMDEVTKINSSTGDIIWRLGGKNNQFNFIGDTIGFSHQHFARRLQNGHLMLFDNGNFHTPPFSRVIEYKLDENSMTAEIQWEYRHSPNIYAFAMGSAQRLSNGNTLIGWGSATTTLTEVNPAGEIVYELSLPANQMSYRAYRDEWGIVTSLPSNTISSDFELQQNYPNPFNPKTNIRYTLNKNSNVTLKIFDMLGREVTTLVNEFQKAGEYNVQFPGSNLNPVSLPSGIYFYSLKTDGKSSVKKMVLIK